MIKLSTLFTLLIISTSNFAQDGYPKPTSKDVLFYIQHSRGKNTFIYQPNFSNAYQLNTNNPIKVSRQLFDKKGEIKPLTNLQKKFAYGVKTKQIAQNHFEIELVSYPGQKLYLKLDKNNIPFVESTINGHIMRINRLFIHLKEGTSGLQVQAEYILFYGIDKDGKSVQAKLIP